MTEKWKRVAVANSVEERGRRIRDLLLAHGDDTILPPKLRGIVVVPKDASKKIAARKLGVGQIFDLALAALERELERRPS